MPQGWRKYPGFGPWSHLPPWERPGWKYMEQEQLQYYPEHYQRYEPVEPSEELKILEREAKYLEERLSQIKSRIEELKKQKFTKRE